MRSWHNCLKHRDAHLPNLLVVMSILAKIVGLNGYNSLRRWTMAKKNAFLKKKEGADDGK